MVDFSVLQSHLTPARIASPLPAQLDRLLPVKREKTSHGKRIPSDPHRKPDSREATHEITSTINVSLHGARVLMKAPWAPDQDVSVRSVPGNLYSRAHIVYCKPLPDQSYSIGPQVLQPTENWPAFK